MSQFLIAHIGHTTKFSEHITWWKPESCGYTICIDKAGLYTEDEAKRICGPTTLCIAVPKAAAQALALSTPYYRLPNGFLAKLYDGGPHAVVPNRKDAWQSLIAARLDCGKHDKPTPRGAKAAAIYLQPAHQGEGRE